MDAADQHELKHDISQDAHRYAEDVRGVAVGGALGRLLVAVNELPVSRERSMVARAPAPEASHPLPRAADNVCHPRVRVLAVAVVGARRLYVVVLACVEINQCVRCTDNSSRRRFAAMNRYRHAIEQASRRWRGGRRDDSARTRRKILISTQVFTAPCRESQEDAEVREELDHGIGHERLELSLIHI